MKIGLLVQLKDNVYECIAKAAQQGFDNGQLAVWDMSLYNDRTVSEVQRACRDFSFTPTETGAYTFYTYRQLSYCSLDVLHGDMSSYTRKEGSYESQIFGTSYPVSFTADLEAEETCYIRAYGYSSEYSYVNLCVKPYEKTSLTVSGQFPWAWAL